MFGERCMNLSAVIFINSQGSSKENTHQIMSTIAMATEQSRETSGCELQKEVSNCGASVWFEGKSQTTLIPDM